MKRSLLLSLALFVAAAPCTSAFADTFNFSFTGSPASGSGQLTARPTIYAPGGPSAFLVTAVTGTATYNGVGTPITGIVPLGTGFQGNDNILFFPGIGVNNSLFFDGNGLGFYLGNGLIVDLYAYGGIYLTLPGGGSLPETGNVNVTTTPEPASFALLATGCLGVGAAARRRLSKA